MTKAGLAGAFGQYDKAAQIYRALIEREPVRPHAYGNLAITLVAMDSAVAAEGMARKALELNPRGVVSNSILSQVLLLQGKKEAALEAAQLETGAVFRLWMLTVIYHALGRKAESDAALKELETKFADGAPYQIAEDYAYRGETEKAFMWLDRAYQQRDPGLSGIKRSVMLRSLWKDPRLGGWRGRWGCRSFNAA